MARRPLLCAATSRVTAVPLLRLQALGQRFHGLVNVLPGHIVVCDEPEMPLVFRADLDAFFPHGGLQSIPQGLGPVGAFGPDTLSLYDKLYLAQFDVIRQVADEGSCVIVGRCADYVLRAYENCYHFFLHAPLEDRMERATKEYGENPNNIKSTVLKHDKARANYYYHYTSQKWGDAKLYDLSLNTSRTGVDGAVKMLLHYLETIHAV